MSARNDLDCLLEKGLISQELYDLLAPIVGITGDLAFALSIVTGSAIAGSVIGGTPISSQVLNGTVLGVPTTPVMVTVPDDAKKGIVTPSGNDVVFTLDGTAPSAPGGTAVNHILKVGSNYTFSAAELKVARFNSFTGVASLYVTYYK